MPVSGVEKPVITMITLSSPHSSHRHIQTASPPEALCEGSE